MPIITAALGRLHWLNKARNASSGALRACFQRIATSFLLVILSPVLSFVTMPGLLSSSLTDAVRQCSQCNEFLPFALFSKKSSNKNGLRSQCKFCDAKYRRSWYAKGGKEKLISYEKENSARVKATRMFYSARQRAQKFNLPFDIDLDHVRALVDENAGSACRCPVLDIPLDYSMRRTAGMNVALPNSPSLDRIVPKLGYVKGNVRIISFRANQLKSNASIQELKLILADATMLGIDW